jgi:NADH-quinone oxidoreductase subunit M
MGGERLILTILVLSPIAVGLLLIVLPLVLPLQVAESVKRVSRNVSLGVALALFAITTWAALASISDINWVNIELGNYRLENAPVELIPYIGVSWHVGADALSLPMIWLTAMLIPVSMLVEWNAKHGHVFHPLLLVMEGALLGVFVALDLFVFFVFWELTLIPMFFLILMWGGRVVAMLR